MSTPGSTERGEETATGRTDGVPAAVEAPTRRRTPAGRAVEPGADPAPPAAIPTDAAARDAAAPAAARTGTGHDAAAPDSIVGGATAPDAAATTVPVGSADETFRHSYSRDRSTLIRRLRRIEGQVRGIERMIEREEYCIDILQQTAALRAAVDAVSLLVLEDHVQGCVRTAAEHGEADRYVDEVLDVVRRTLGRPVRTPR